MPRSIDFEKIYKRFVKTYGSEKGEKYYYAYINKKGYDDTKPFPKKGEKKEKTCIVKGFEVKEEGGRAIVSGFIATDHPDDLDMEEHGIADVIPEETLESFAKQLRADPVARAFGVHHSEADGTYYGFGDPATASVQSLSDGHKGLFISTVIDTSTPRGMDVAKEFQEGTLHSFSITYDTDGFTTTDFEERDGRIVRIIGPETRLRGYTGASNPVNPNAISTEFAFKEFKEMLQNPPRAEVSDMSESKEAAAPVAQPKETKELASETKSATIAQLSPEEMKEFAAYKKSKETKEIVDEVLARVAEKAPTKEKKEDAPLSNTAENAAEEGGEVPQEVKEYLEVLAKPKEIELKEQFRRAGEIVDKFDIWGHTQNKTAGAREFKTFGVGGKRGTELEFKSLGMTTNQNTATTYLLSTAELADVFDPIIYNALNQQTKLWNYLAKDDYSNKGNNQVQFTLKIAANATAGFYTGNAITTGEVSREKFQTKFKKAQVGVEIDGDVLAAARGGPVGDLFAQEVYDSTIDLMSMINKQLFLATGAETDAAIIGLKYLCDSATNTTLYGVTRSATNRLAPDSATDTFIDNGGGAVSIANIRKGIRQCLRDGSEKNNLLIVTSLTQADLWRGKLDPSRRLNSPLDTSFGFSTDLFIDGVPVLVDKDCLQASDSTESVWFVVDTFSHRIGMWIPPTLELLGKNADSRAGFIKTYFAVYNRAPRRLAMVYDCATS